jgi:hypothetical protein
MRNYLGQTGLFKKFSNIPGWKTKRHLVVLESDDWGSVRMPSVIVYDTLSEAGFNFAIDEGFRFNRYDSLETACDLADLYEVLSTVKDCMGRPAVLTPVAVVANPDFDRILNSGFAEYFYEPFTETFKKNPGCENSFSLWKEGMERRIFVPQFHGREHLNVKVWINALKNGNERAHKAFNNQMWGITTADDPTVRVEFMAAFDFLDVTDLIYHKEVIDTGLDLFKDLFGYSATYFVPPNGPLSTKLENFCFEKGIKYLSLPRKQSEPVGNGLTRTRIHWMGKKGKSGLRYITRNCFFEPSDMATGWVERCLSEICEAFRWQKPAVISSHRVNFIGALYPENRKNGLTQLQQLLKQIVNTWPDVEFITSAELGELMNNG